MSNPNPNTDNLTPFQPGQSGNPNGKKKGLKNLSTLVRQVLGNDELFDELLRIAPNNKAKTQLKVLKELKDKRAGNALVLSMLLKSISGDTKAAEWLRKAGYGDRLSLVDDEDRPILPVYVASFEPPKPKPKRKAKPKAVKKKPNANKSKAKPSSRSNSK